MRNNASKSNCLSMWRCSFLGSSVGVCLSRPAGFGGMCVGLRKDVCNWKSKSWYGWLWCQPLETKLRAGQRPRTIERHLNRTNNSAKPERGLKQLSGEVLKDNLPVLKRTDFQENQIHLSNMQVLIIPGNMEIIKLLCSCPLPNTCHLQMTPASGPGFLHILTDTCNAGFCTPDCDSKIAVKYLMWYSSFSSIFCSRRYGRSEQATYPILLPITYKPKPHMALGPECKLPYELMPFNIPRYWNWLVLIGIKTNWYPN